MYSGLSQVLSQVDCTRKTAIINHELRKLNIVIAALQETRLPLNDSIREQECTICWQGWNKMKIVYKETIKSRITYHLPPSLNFDRSSEHPEYLCSHALFYKRGKG
jgi:hypothetical protein